MQPTLSPRNSCNLDGRAGLSIDRRRNKFRTYSAKKPPAHQTFSKKLVVFKCMSPRSPKSFPRKETDIVMKGFVTIGLDYIESEIRQEIYEVLCNAGLKTLSNKDFEFIDVNGKTGCVLNKKEGSEFNGRIIKQVAGTGAVYIRLLKQPIFSDSSDDDDQFLPPLPFSFHKHSKEHDVNKTHGSAEITDQSVSSVQQPKSSESLDLEAFANKPSTSQMCPSHMTESPVARLGPSTSETTPSKANAVIKPLNSVCDLIEPHLTEASSKTSEVVSYPATSTPDLYASDIKQLQQPFPNYPQKFIEDLYTVSKYDFTATLECLLDGNLSAVLTLMNDKVLGGSPDLSISVASLEDKDELIASAFQFYKKYHHHPLCDLSITLKTQPAIDAGGVRRAFFTKIFEHVAGGYMGIFEGPPNRLRPSYKMSTLNSGVLKTIGQMIAHSLLLDKLGFPYLSPPCYYYMAGKWDTAVMYITDEDVSSRVHNVLLKVRMHQYWCDIQK